MKRLKMKTVAYLSKVKDHVGVYRTTESTMNRKIRVKAIEVLARLNPSIRFIFIHKGSRTLEKGRLTESKEGPRWIFYKAAQCDRIDIEHPTKPWKPTKRKSKPPPSPKGAGRADKP